MLQETSGGNNTNRAAARKYRILKGTTVMRGATTTRGDKANTESVIGLLNDALATEVICILRYKRHCYMTAGIGDRQVKAKFLQLVTEDGEHADHLVERQLLRCQSDHVEGDSLVEMMTADLIAERIAIESYRDMIAAIGLLQDLLGRGIIKILVQKEAQAGSLAALLSE